ncbi:MAG TPA: histidine kinase [Lacisediminihabitans sp.]|uniref:sensor histidine kinase n=1 Tax=Lacisediminihabitans sp. TaxID=2787631 RepID=UPI002ED7AC28
MNPVARRPLGLGDWLGLFGVAIVTFYLTTEFATVLPAWVVVAAYLAVAAWLGLAVVPRKWTALVGALLLTAAVCGALAATATAGLLIVPVAVAVMRAVSDLARPIRHGVALALLAVALVAVGATILVLPVLGLLSIEGGIVIALFAGVSRRQFRAAERQSRRLLEERVAIREEQARARVLAERQAVARDIHDVLAHSLGGLVIQLDAVEALLEADRIADAARRVHDARALAVDGLVEARRAVDALRDGGPLQGPQDVMETIEQLVRSHRSLGSAVELGVSGEPWPLPPATATAVARTVQESLTNARRHAPGKPVTLRLRWRPDGMDLEVVNRISSPSSATPGGGHGLTGMAERFRALPDSRFSAGERDGRFVVSASVGAP